MNAHRAVFAFTLCACGRIGFDSPSLNSNDAPFDGEQSDARLGPDADPAAPWVMQSGIGPARYAFGMAFDSARARAVVFGGINTVNSSETWEWDGTAWSMRNPPTSPAARSSRMVYDVALARTVLFGGFDGSVRRNDTWQYDGTTWAHFDSTTGLPTDELRDVEVDGAGRVWLLTPDALLILAR